MMDATTKPQTHRRCRLASVILCGSAQLLLIACGPDGVTPVCTDVPLYPNRGTAQPSAQAVTATTDAIKEGCLSAVGDGKPPSSGGGGD